VRSARQDDLALLRQFGKPGFAYSGATPHLLPFIARARVVNQYDTPAYFRDDNRVAPHNLYADGRVLRAEAPGASTARDIGFRFGPPRPVAGSGTAVVLRDGRAWRVHWSRPDPDSGTTYTLPSGARMTFAPGQVWVVLTTTNWATAGL